MRAQRLLTNQVLFILVAGFLIGCGTENVDTSNPEEVQMIADSRLEFQLGTAIDNLKPYAQNTNHPPITEVSRAHGRAHVSGPQDVSGLIQKDPRHLVATIIADFETLITTAKHMLKDGATIGKEKNRVRFRLGTDICDNSMVIKPVGQINCIT